MPDDLRPQVEGIASVVIRDPDQVDGGGCGKRAFQLDPV
ncbi:MAG: hypothetical protein QOD93_1707, partial [Acetobacteraceae bacterium]|nr:hypothetical protein [Acetobacteraceae bacterium]